MPLIPIPYIKQPKNSQKCGLACASMLLNHYVGKKIDQEVAFQQIKTTSELNRFYCKTHKISDYLTNAGLPSTVVRFLDLKLFISFCNENNIAPILNHRDLNNNIGGHFSVVKNITENILIINDPENKNITSVSIEKMVKHINKKGPYDEIGGNIAIVPFIESHPNNFITCVRCRSNVNVSFIDKANSNTRLIEHYICNGCDYVYEA